MGWLQQLAMLVALLWCLVDALSFGPASKRRRQRQRKRRPGFEVNEAPTQLGLPTAPVVRATFVAQNRARLEFLGEAQPIEVDTRLLDQHLDEAAWLAARSALDVTASEFAAAAFDESRFVSRASLLLAKAGLREHNVAMNEAILFGRRNEAMAIDQYRRETGHRVAATGLWTDDECRFGASPDGLVTDRDHGDGLLEVKCLYAMRNKPALPNYSRCPRRYYAQIQGQLLLCHRPWCDLVCW